MALGVDECILEGNSDCIEYGKMEILGVVVRYNDGLLLGMLFDGAKQVGVSKKISNELLQYHDLNVSNL